MPDTFNDIAAVVATRDYTAARAWYSRVIGREPDIEPIDRVAEWQIAATAWLQLIEDADRAGKSAVRFGVDDVAAQTVELNDLGIATGEVVEIADMVKVIDVVDPDGNEVSFVEDLSTS
jgi:catechol 2,3-dioxygenase-like lactoylglutathione lyase family enzyme